MCVTAHFEATADESVRARIHGRWRDNAFLAQNESLCGLESGAWRISSHNCAVEERLAAGVVEEHLVVFAANATHEQVGVVGRA